MRIGPQSALFGPMLKTSCGSDAVCLLVNFLKIIFLYVLFLVFLRGDSVPEAGEKYPDQQLELEVMLLGAL